MPTLVFVLGDRKARKYFLAWKIPATRYGSEGLEPKSLADCPFFQEHGDEISCVSGSGGSLCGGFMGGPPGYVYCIWGLWASEASHA